MIEAGLTVRMDAPIGTISPRLYGQFAEHLGRCCYDGLWVGLESDIPNQGGLRRDVIAALKALPVPLLRWPGGCYAEHYHWKDGIGAPDKRPRRLGTSCGLRVEDDNGLGTNEFIEFCHLIGAEPYLAGNVGSGTPQELCDWVEYCNGIWDTDLTRQRTANGSAEPFNVRLWGVGNENWGCGGNFDAVSYAREYRRFATMLRHIDPDLELVLCGTGDATTKSDVWNGEVLRTLVPHIDLVDHLSIHHYWIHGGAEADFDEDQYYDLLAEVELTESFVRRTADLIVTETGDSRIGIALDEWGVWHPEARSWGPGEVERRDPTTYEQACTLRDALAVGIALEGFHRQCRVLKLANMAQVVNILHAVVMTEGTAMWVTPTYHALRLHAPHIGATALEVGVRQNETIPGDFGAVSATASRGADGLAVTLINRHYDDPAVVRIGGTNAHEFLGGDLLTADQPNAQNSAAQPNHVTTIPLSARDVGNEWLVELPPHSMATIRLR